MFPGTKGHLSVITETVFADPKDSFCLKIVWKFVNQNKDVQSYINNIHIWEERTSKITFIKVYLNTFGCQHVEKAFAEHTMYSGFCHVMHTQGYIDFCSFYIMNFTAMTNFLDCLMISYDFDPEALQIMKNIYDRIKMQ